MSGVRGAEPGGSAPSVVCPHCGEAVPAGNFCGSCGAHLSDPRVGARAARRRHAYAVAPHESLARLSIVTALFPHLGRRSLAPFRVALGVIAGLLALFGALGLEVPIVAVSAIGVPLLFQLYVYEVGPYGEAALLPSLATVGLGAALGALWALVAGPIVNRALLPELGSPLGSSHALLAAVLVPVVAQLLMLVPLGLVALRAARYPESLDGFVIGASGALGFTFAAALVDLAGRLGAGVAAREPVGAALVEAAIRGLAVPLVAALGTGLLAATLWVRRKDGTVTGARLWSSPLLVLGVVLAVAVGLGFADIARIGDLALLGVHLGALVLLALVVRVGLHHVLLLEAHPFRIGPPRVCPNCHRVTPAMAFCPNCGVAERATAKTYRRRAELDDVAPGGAR